MRTRKGSKGYITDVGIIGPLIGVELDGTRGRIWFELDEIELDKNYIVQQIIDDL